MSDMVTLSSPRFGGDACLLSVCPSPRFTLDSVFAGLLTGSSPEFLISAGTSADADLQFVA